MSKNYLITTSIIFLSLLSIAWLAGRSYFEKKPTLLSVKKIWDASPHAAFTDLIRYGGKWLVAFREADQHVGGNDGAVRILESADGEHWETASLFREDGIDLRDPKLSITPEGKLMLLLGGTQYSKEGEYVTSQPRVAFSDDGRSWSVFKKVIEPHEWLWRVTWHDGKAWGIAYRSTNLGSKDADWIATLYSSPDGIQFEKVAKLKIDSRPSEATIRFSEDGQMRILIRRGGSLNAHAWIGTSQKPYREFVWSDSGQTLGGPNFLILPENRMWASARIYKIVQNEVLEKTALGKMTNDRVFPLLELPSGGDDTGYPGMAYHEGTLWISYYSSHEGEQAAIYVAKVQIP